MISIIILIIILIIIIYYNYDIQIENEKNYVDIMYQKMKDNINFKSKFPYITGIISPFYT